jgi:hypothetical protein
MVVVILDDRCRTGSLSSQAAARLASLGVTRVAVLRRDETLAFVLEGWSFDPARSEREAVGAIAPDRSSATTLRAVMETMLHTTPERS